MPVHSAIAIQIACFSAFFPSFAADIGSRSTRIRVVWLPSIFRSIQRKISVYTVCGHAKPHHSRPAIAVNRKSDSAAMISRTAR